MSWIVDAICAHLALSLPHHPCPIATVSFAINALNPLCCSQRQGSAAKPKASSQKQGSCLDAPSVKHWWEFGRKDIIGCFLSHTPPPWRIRHVFWPGKAHRRPGKPAQAHGRKQPEGGKSGRPSNARSNQVGTAQYPALQSMFTKNCQHGLEFQKNGAQSIKLRAPFKWI
jgi:hypothetical protein